MQKHIAIVHQAVAEFKAYHFEESVALLWKAYDRIELTSLYFTDDSYNAIYDGLEMLDLLVEQLPIFEKNAYAVQLLNDFRIVLDGKQEVDLLIFQKMLLEIQDFMLGVKISLNFLNQFGLSLTMEPAIVSIGLIEGSQIQLYKWEESERVEAIIKAFNASFKETFLNIKELEEAIKMALINGNPQKAKDLYIKMIQVFPNSKKEAFLELGELHYQDKEYRQAIDCYMKTIVMGTPKEQLRQKIQKACNTMARESENSKEANRWRELLINYFA